MPKPSFATFCFRQCLHLNRLDLFATGEDDLRDAVAAVDDERLVGQVDEDDAYLSTVVGVDGAGGVEDGDAFFDSQATARPHLTLIAFGNLHVKACGDQGSLHRLKGDRTLREIGAKIHAR